ncbi:DNA mismatch repair protein MutT [Paenibacillus montaniterrae]|uniref:DNA mismatch repair protein MutT n=1 Tax=Paenibacillus montaniterrae TaxID=429341 RepID=A0A919YVT5_9BACL|nr:NUDIX domain-containing protein [Paenibacillus montaniterrae]GIP18176.1 DNA mismatch repair protein MutT [Paenibacillus montaniterrae]
MKPIRNSAKAIIIENNQLLLTRNQDEQGFFYLFPGGGQEKGEELKVTVERECNEELGCEVVVGDIVYIREYIGKNHEFAEWDYDVHQVEFYFECRIKESVEKFIGTNPDNNQVGVEWIEIDSLNKLRIYPSKLSEKIMNRHQKGCYMGDTN